MHVAMVYIQPFRHNSLLECALQPKSVRSSPKSPILGFKVIDVDKSKKPATSACYGK